MSHTPGTIRVVQAPDGTLPVYDLKIGGWYIAYCPGGLPEGRDKANAERLAACWNFCAAMSTEQIISATPK